MIEGIYNGVCAVGECAGDRAEVRGSQRETLETTHEETAGLVAAS